MNVRIFISLTRFMYNTLTYSTRREKVHKICDQIREKMRIAFNENHCRVNFVVRKHAALLLCTVICGSLHFITRSRGYSRSSAKWRPPERKFSIRINIFVFYDCICSGMISICTLVASISQDSIKTR